MLTPALCPPHDHRRGVQAATASLISEGDKVFKATSIKTNGDNEKGFIVVRDPDLLFINERETKERMRWPIKYVRGFGQNEGLFSLETRRKCQNGSGVYFFDVKNGKDITADLDPIIESHKPTVSASDVALSCVREYLARHGLSATLACLDEEAPKPAGSIDRRNDLAKVLNIKNLVHKAKEKAREEANATAKKGKKGAERGKATEGAGAERKAMDPKAKGDLFQKMRAKGTPLALGCMRDAEGTPLGFGVHA